MLSRKIEMQTLISWKKLRLHLGILTKFPYKNFLPPDVVEELTKWKKAWEEMDNEVMKKWRNA